VSGQSFGGGVRSVVAVQVELAEADRKWVVLKKLRPARLPSPGSPVLVAGRVLGVAEIALPRLSTVPVPELQVTALELPDGVSEEAPGKLVKLLAMAFNACGNLAEHPTSDRVSLP